MTKFKTAVFGMGLVCGVAVVTDAGAQTTSFDCFNGEQNCVVVTKNGDFGSAIKVVAPSTDYGIYSDSGAGFFYVAAIAGVSQSGNGDGVRGSVPSGASGAAGVRGTTSSSNTSYGVYGSTSAPGSSFGVYGTTTAASYGVYGKATAASAYAVFGSSTGNNSFGVYGDATGTTSYGVYGHSTQAAGVFGVTAATGGNGVRGQGGPSGNGVYGALATAGAGAGVYGENNTTAAGAFAGYFHGRLHVTGAAECDTCSTGVWVYTGSDARMKKDIEPITNGLDRVTKLRPVTFKWKAPDEHGGDEGTQRGFIAQEVEKVLPDWVSTNEKGMKGVNYNGLFPLLVDSVKTLKSENDELRLRVKSLETTRPVATAGVNGNGLLGLGLMALAGAIVYSRRERKPAS